MAEKKIISFIELSSKHIFDSENRTNNFNEKIINDFIKISHLLGYPDDKYTARTSINGFLSISSNIRNKNDIFSFWFIQSLYNDKNENHYNDVCNKLSFSSFEIPYSFAIEAYKTLKETLHSYNIQGNKKGFEEILYTKLKRYFKKNDEVYLKFFKLYIPNYLKHYEITTGIKIK